MPAEGALPGPLALSRQAHDRAAHRRRDAGWLAARWPTAKVLVVNGRGHAAVADAGLVALSGAAADALPGRAAPPVPDRLFLGEAGGDAWFAAVLAADAPAPDGSRWASLRDVGARVDDLEAGLFTSAAALVVWHARHPFCPHCGAPSVPDDGGWHRRCTAEGVELFPRTDPAVIMLVHDGGDRCVLGRQATWDPGRFSVLAGFVEAGEPLEAAVVREVGEEVGLAVTDVRYVGSQPWPFPQSLMIGCVARAVSGTLARPDDELAEAHWFTRAEVAAAATWDDATAADTPDAPGLGPGGALRALPPPVSIARQLLDAWVAGRL